MSGVRGVAASELQCRVDRIRNVCILAHVDHGKTTLSDHLVSSNGIISSRLAGQVRYLDSRPDEQERCITMKSSAISLIFNDTRQPDDPFLVNLIDSPGHIDFSSEVSTATRLCDGALILVDVVEGIQVQTQSVLRQAWREGVLPCLVLNKMDRLIIELALSPADAYRRCSQLIEAVNALVSTFHTADLMAAAHDTTTLDDDYRAQIIFAPERGNVVFASASDCWAFGIAEASQFYGRVLGMNVDALKKVLFGEFYYQPKLKSISRKATTAAPHPMFVHYVLTNIWQVYHCLLATSPPTPSEKIDRLVTSLGIDIPRRDLITREPRTRLQAIMRAWYPLSPAILNMCVTCLPSPDLAAVNRLDRIWPNGLTRSSPALSQAALHCTSNIDDPVLVVIAKMVSVTPDQFPSSSRSSNIVRRPYVRQADLAIAAAAEA